MRKTAKYFMFFLFVTISLSGFSQKNPQNTNNQSVNQRNLFDTDPNFKMYFFGIEPTRSESTVPTELGNILMVTYMYEEGTNAAYMLARAAYPKEKVKNSNPKDMLNGAISGFNDNLKLIISTQKDIKIKNYPGIYFESSGGTYFTAATFYLVDNVLYQIAILRADRKPTTTEINKFLFSFQLK